MPSDKKQEIIIGGIIKHTNGVGFKITFKDRDTANKYKDMFRWIPINDQHPLVYKLGYYDYYEENGMVKTK